ncbi:hypothetical protein ACSSV1_000588 [Labrenzia sp. MBR-25]
MAIIDEDEYASLVSFECERCCADVRDVILMPSHSLVERDENRLSTQGEADILCSGCSKKYRLEVRNSSGRVFARVNGHPTLPVACSGPFHPEELDEFGCLLWEIPDTPSDYLVDALKDVEEVIKTKDAIFYARPLSRMAFIQQFAALEAYLADTLTKQVLENSETLSRALTGVKELKDIKLTLADIVAEPDIVKVTVAKVLREMLYHKFMKVDAIWNITLNFSLFPSEELKKRMLNYELIRHDCVHRNGKDKDGNERTEVDFNFVAQMANDLYAMLDHIEDALHSSTVQ